MQASKRGYDLAAMYLPPKEILSLEVTDRGGESWSEDTMGGCGPWKGGVGDKDAKKPYGIFLDPSLAPFEKVNGVLSTRRPVDTFRTRGWRAFSRSSLPHKVSV
jgi:hypothetical protein